MRAISSAAIVVFFILLLVIRNVMAVDTCVTDPARCDVDGNGTVNSLDLQIVAQHFGPVVGGATSTFTPTIIATPIASSTFTSTSTPTALPPTPTRTNTAVPTATPTLSAGCPSNQCGTPRYFCDTWTGGWCHDYRANLDTSFEVGFPGATNDESVNCNSSTNIGVNSQPVYLNDMQEGQVPYPDRFSTHEHFMLRLADGQFGMCVVRYPQPFDLAGREAHIHFDVDLKTSARTYPRLVLSPEIVKAVTDDRTGVRKPLDSLEVSFINGRFDTSVTSGGMLRSNYNPTTTYHGTDNVRDHVDVYVSRAHIRIIVNGIQYISTAVADTGWDRAYLYLGVVDYDGAKDGQVGATINTWHFDNVAVDGATLPTNSLSGPQTVAFNAYGATACSVDGYPATLQSGENDEHTWYTWTAIMPVHAVDASDVACVGGSNIWRWDRVPRDFEVVKP